MESAGMEQKKTKQQGTDGGGVDGLEVMDGECGNGAGKKHRSCSKMVGELMDWR